MSLDWNIQKVENYKEKCWIKQVDAEGNPILDGDGDEQFRLNPVTESLTFALMAIGINQITEKNHIEVYVRLRAYEGLFGAYLYRNGEDRPYTLQDVEAHIGLHTNVSDMTGNQFYKSLVERAKRDFVREED